MFFLTRSFNLIIFFLILLFPMLRKNLRFIVFGAILGILIIFFIFNLNRISGYFNIDARLRYYSTALKIFLKDPLWGYGLGSFKQLYASYHTGEFVQYVHNIFLQHLVDGGLIFFSVFIWLLVYLFKNIKLKDSYIPIAILIHNLFSFSFYSSSVLILFFVMFAIGIGNKNPVQMLKS